VDSSRGTAYCELLGSRRKVPDIKLVNLTIGQHWFGRGVGQSTVGDGGGGKIAMTKEQ